MRANSSSSPAVLMVLGSCVSLQFGAAIATPLLAHFGPGLTTAFRLLLAALLLAAVFRPQVWRYSRQQWRAVLYFGVAMAGMNGFFFAAIARIPLGFAVTIEFAGPLLLAAVLSRRARDLGCVLAAAVAIVVLCLGKADVAGQAIDLRGVCYALIAGGFWALYILTSKNLGQRISGHGALSAGMLVGAIVIAPFGISGLPALAADPVQLWTLLGVAVLSSVIPYLLEFSALRRLAPHTFGVLLSLEPAVAAIAGWLLLAQAMTWVQALAIAVVIAASAVATLGQSQPRSKHREDARETSTPARDQCTVQV